MPLHQRTQNFTDNLKTMYIRTPKVTSLCFHFSFLDQSKMQKHNLMLQSKSACIIQGASVGCHQTYFYMNLFILRSCSGGGSKCKQNVCTLSQTIYHMTTLCDHPKTKDKWISLHCCYICNLYVKQMVCKINLSCPTEEFPVGLLRPCAFPGCLDRWRLPFNITLVLIFFRCDFIVFILQFNYCPLQFPCKAPFS